MPLGPSPDAVQEHVIELGEESHEMDFCVFARRVLARGRTGGLGGGGQVADVSHFGVSTTVEVPDSGSGELVGGVDRSASGGSQVGGPLSPWRSSAIGSQQGPVLPRTWWRRFTISRRWTRRCWQRAAGSAGGRASRVRESTRWSRPARTPRRCRGPRIHQRQQNWPNGPSGKSCSPTRPGRGSRQAGHGAGVLQDGLAPGHGRVAEGSGGPAVGEACRAESGREAARPAAAAVGGRRRHSMSESSDLLGDSSDALGGILAGRHHRFRLSGHLARRAVLLNPAGRRLVGLDESQPASAVNLRDFMPRSRGSSCATWPGRRSTRPAAGKAAASSATCRPANSRRVNEDVSRQARRGGRATCLVIVHREAGEQDRSASGPGRGPGPKAGHPRIVARSDHHDQPPGDHHRVQQGGRADFRSSAGEGAGHEAVRGAVSAAISAGQQDRIDRYLDVGEGSMLGRRVEVTAVRANGETFDAEMAMTISREQGVPVLTFFIRDISRAEEGRAGAAAVCGRVGAVEPRTGAVRLRRFARPPGAAAEDPHLQRPPANDVRRQARRGGATTASSGCRAPPRGCSR